MSQRTWNSLTLECCSSPLFESSQRTLIFRACCFLNTQLHKTCFYNHLGVHLKGKAHILKTVGHFFLPQFPAHYSLHIIAYYTTPHDDQESTLRVEQEKIEKRITISQ